MPEESSRRALRGQAGLHVLGPHIDPFAAHLGVMGYAPLTLREKVRYVRQFSRWMELKRVRFKALDEALIDKALEHDARTGDRRRTLLQFLEHLREKGVASPAATRGDGPPAARLEQRYAHYLDEERGLAEVTIVNYRSLLRPLLTEQFGDGPIRLTHLSPRDVTDFLLRHLKTMSPKRGQLLGCALRSFLRFLFLELKTKVDLSLAVPTVRQFRKAAVPQYLVAEDVERIIAVCDLGTAVGRRNRAVLLLLARLGLRAGEVVRLELGDVHWRTGELLVRGKGQFHDRLPLPKDVGEALTLYLTKDRTPCSSRRLFLRMRAPRRGFEDAAAVTSLVKRAIDRSGLSPPHRGAHLLRHSLATGMIRRGATMAEIGQLLRHRSPNTTEIYAKVDFDGLRSVALPWLGTGGAR